jgi:2-desacetyl-2-hydroxyethyl bacteriochlorophyllide A dehydrogenase
VNAAAAATSRRALVFAGLRQVEIVDEPLDAPAAGMALVRSLVSAISAGTELLAYRGQLPADMAIDETLPAMAGGAFQFPFSYGYATVGRVEAVGAGVDPGLVGRRVFAFVPHASAFLARVADLLPVPDDLSTVAAALYANQETAVNLLLDGAPRLGERVAVVGQGVVGLLTTGLLAGFPLETLVVVEPSPSRAALARRMGAKVAVASEAEARVALGQDTGQEMGNDTERVRGGADLTFEVSGNPAALDTALRLTGREGRVVVGSFYGDKRAPVDLGGHFHRGRLTVISSQVSHIGPALSGRWDRRRRTRATFAALAGVDAAALCSHRIPFARAAEAYRLLDQPVDQGTSGPLQIMLEHQEDENR